MLTMAQELVNYLLRAYVVLLLLGWNCWEYSRDGGQAFRAGGTKTVTEVLPLIQPGWRIGPQSFF